MCVSGRATQEECFIAWEEILKRNGEANNDYSYKQFLAKSIEYAKLLNDYQLIKAILIKLHFVVDDEHIALLKSKGYKIDTSSGSKYANSLSAALRKCENLITKMVMKQNELNNTLSEKEQKPVNLEQLLAHISAGLGYEIKDDITLARYNEYKKILEAKNKQHGRNNQARHNF